MALFCHHQHSANHPLNNECHAIDAARFNYRPHCPTGKGKAGVEPTPLTTMLHVQINHWPTCTHTHATTDRPTRANWYSRRDRTGVKSNNRAVCSAWGNERERRRWMSESCVVWELRRARILPSAASKVSSEWIGASPHDRPSQNCNVTCRGLFEPNGPERQIAALSEAQSNLGIPSESLNNSTGRGFQF